MLDARAEARGLDIEVHSVGELESLSRKDKLGIEDLNIWYFPSYVD